ncbi:glycoside hydrolase family 2 TIM barrel-domain containing protein [Pedobacter sp. SL55]|uniref:glycoside hydrolase family 2 TIM barrel-domain containing protein n=1 Tax=Pedobacter sp. SL55 TaxID=2995161 RepID=UPI002271C87C|nr:glycoside hydrolase family 2 TIM barrel-domain containing protein [Pedobacter sp. SL55]WAC39636.1 malectin domain-containing carbohydrate-binding protein [Pedobacter sp. SL55]
MVFKISSLMPITFKKFLSFLLFVVVFTSAKAQEQSRKIISINQNWHFAKDIHKKGNKQLKYTTVNIPHTWNALDVLDDEPGYYRGIGYYKKKLDLKSEWKGKKIYLNFGAANQETEVYLNGKKIGSHIGGYTGFTVALDQLNFDGKDELVVKVDNSYNESIPPLTGDFTFFGGLYRDVSLTVVDQAHFADEIYGTNGVYVHADKVSNESATLNVNANWVNTSSFINEILVTTTLIDAKSNKVGESKWLSSKNPSRNINLSLPKIEVKNPTLWSPENPYLYQTITKLIDYQTGKVLDEVKTNVGFRYFSFDADKGFFLNGKLVKLIGASRHQDFAKMGNAVPAALQVKDVALLKEMGGNFLRVAHYPQDQAVLDACDRLGILTSVEIPIVNEITETEAFYNNCKEMQLEMIKQNYNHTSIIIWAYMNEVLLKMRYGKEPERKKIYLKSIENLAQQLEELTRKTDPTRYTMMSNHGDVTGYTNAGLVKIPMIVGWNLYQGWYGGKSEDFGPNLDEIHAAMPNKPLIVTEYGADVDPRIHAENPIRFDKSLAYGMQYHQIYIRDILKRPFVAGAAVWNLSDFSSETRNETMPSINNKGLLTLDRQPKNTYFLYKAHFNKNPYVKIGDGSWKLRGGTSTLQEVSVISNLDSAELVVNGKPQGKKRVVDCLVSWNIDFKSGKNEIEAIAYQSEKVFKDKSTIDFVLQPQAFLNSSASLNILLGSQRQFIDDKNQIWLPSKPHQDNSWGHIGGEPFKIKNSSRQQYGSDKDIKGTLNDPIYQTQSVGLDAYELVVPKGKYEVTLHFAELMGNGIQSVLPYNLDSLVATGKEVPPQRIFDVYLNGKLVIKALNLAAKYGVATKLEQKFECVVADDKGIKLAFKSITGKPVLNALQFKKIN